MELQKTSAQPSSGARKKKRPKLASYTWAGTSDSYAAPLFNRDENQFFNSMSRLRQVADSGNW